MPTLYVNRDGDIIGCKSNINKGVRQGYGGLGCFNGHFHFEKMVKMEIRGRLVTTSFF